MKQLVMRQGHDDFEAFKIGQACLKVGGDVVSVTVNPLMVFDHMQGRQKPVPEGPLTWIVWMTFDASFNPDVLDTAIEEENA